ncbi:MAG: hypothetical protein KGL74_12325, partial [Elusimicrobia bacterium]|nr:hypothetical protein [Elusimicrobiota bacterium]
AASSETRGIRGLFAVVLLVGGLLGLRAVASGPGGWFALAWLTAVAAGSAWSGAGPFPFEDPVLAVLAGAGLSALAGLSG